MAHFSPREREIVANVARYHRKALPKPRHENFARLSGADQELVGKLGGILRLADGLDRPVTSTASGQDWAYVSEHSLPGLVRTCSGTSSLPIIGPVARTTPRSITFSSSRTLPGQS